MKVLNVDDQNISDAQMRSISAKTMVIVGDADGVKPEHALSMFELRGGGDEEAAASGMLQKVPAARLVILPAASHIGISGETAVLVPMVSAFSIMCRRRRRISSRLRRHSGSEIVRLWRTNPSTARPAGQRPSAYACPTCGRPSRRTGSPTIQMSPSRVNPTRNVSRNTCA